MGENVQEGIALFWCICIVLRSRGAGLSILPVSRGTRGAGLAGAAGLLWFRNGESPGSARASPCAFVPGLEMLILPFLLYFLP